jgi:hypothetical protein
MTTDPKRTLDYMLQLDLRRFVEQQLGVEQWGTGVRPPAERERNALLRPDPERPREGLPGRLGEILRRHLEATITFDNFELTVSAVVHSMYPPATLTADPDEPVALNDALAHGLRACGLDDRLEDVASALREFLRPRFEKRVLEFEAMRQKALAGE